VNHRTAEHELGRNVVAWMIWDQAALRPFGKSVVAPVFIDANRCAAAMSRGSDPLVRLVHGCTTEAVEANPMSEMATAVPSICDADFNAAISAFTAATRTLRGSVCWRLPEVSTKNTRFKLFETAMQD
jgi:hypothetical protein